MRTIVQDYGPIYGEPVNGTVLGRPNGSVYVPSSNTINIQKFVEELRFVRIYNGYVRICKSDGSVSGSDPDVNVVARSQDLSSIIQMQVFSDALLTTMECYRTFAAGNFNVLAARLSVGDSPIPEIVDDQTYYFRAQLFNNGTAVATSDTIAIKGVVPS